MRLTVAYLGVGCFVSDISFLLQQAERFRRLAREIVDHKAQEALLAMAEEYEARAKALAAGQHPSP